MQREQSQSEEANHKPLEDTLQEFQFLYRKNEFQIIQ
jgi:hypothetical protein